MRFLNIRKFLKQRKLRRKGMSSHATRSTEAPKRLGHILNTSIIIRIAIGVLVFALVVIAITLFGRHYNIGVTVGFKAALDHRNSFNFTFEDREKTEQKKEEVRGSIPDIYRFEEDILEQDFTELKKHIMDWKSEVQKFEASEETTPSTETHESIRAKYTAKIKSDIPVLDDEQIDLIMSLEKPIAAVETLRTRLEKFFKYRLFLGDANKIPGHDLKIVIRDYDSFEKEVEKDIRDSIQQNTELSKMSNEDIYRLPKVPFFFVGRANLDQFYIRDDFETKKLLMDAAALAVKPQTTTVSRNSTIVLRDTVINPDHVVQLRRNHQEAEKERFVPYYFGTVAITLICLIIFILYLRLYRNNLFVNNSRLAVIGIVLFISVALSKVPITLGYIHPFFDYPLFISFAAVLLTLLFDVSLACVASFIIAILIGVMYDFSLPHAFLTLSSGFIVSFLSRNARRRSDLIQTSFLIGVANAILVFIVSSAVNLGVAVSILWQCLGGFIAGGLGTAFAAGALPFFETIFRITTNIRLMDLTDTKHPLLRRLIMEAPGSYHHSLVVANLAEAAAENIGANPLLARVAAYYHDIGKLKKPGYFSENEKSPRSKHDTLVPSMSSLVITSHVKDGVDLALKYRLNREIIDIIRQHHGTSLVYYFYKRALDANGQSEPVNKDDFRYPGPKPGSREAAILMLADAVEAASRSLDRVSTSKLSSLVREIITKRFEDGQLDECELTMKDLYIIENTFVHILIGSLHQRVKYPKEDESGQQTATRSAEEEGMNGRNQEQPNIVKN